MAKLPNPELVVITKTYDLVLWSCRHLAKFPWRYRFTVGLRVVLPLRPSTLRGAVAG